MEYSGQSSGRRLVPVTGIEFAPSPGVGKSLILAMQRYSQYKPGSNMALRVLHGMWATPEATERIL